MRFLLALLLVLAIPASALAVSIEEIYGQRDSIAVADQDNCDLRTRIWNGMAQAESENNQQAMTEFQIAQDALDGAVFSVESAEYYNGMSEDSKLKGWETSAQVYYDDAADHLADDDTSLDSRDDWYGEALVHTLAGEKLLSGSSVDDESNGGM